MAQQKAAFIKVPTEQTDGFQSMPTEPSNRLPDTDLRTEICTETDALKIAEAFYICFPAEWWAQKEPIELRPAEHLRHALLAKRLLPAFKYAHIVFVKAVLVATGETIGVAGWSLPSNPDVHNLFRRSAVEHYGWQTLLGWSDAEVEEMWAHVAPDWNSEIEKDDDRRREVMDGKPHWYLAPLLVWPEYQGRGVGSRLMRWAIEKADATVPATPMYLECMPSARAVYLHLGFETMDGCRMVRRGPGVTGMAESAEERDVQNTGEKLGV
ncbi:acetyltransferase [Pyrenophora tritici-repentis]|nr:acetyltransferase [Pyrenophora tritici-repentis]